MNVTVLWLYFFFCWCWCPRFQWSNSEQCKFSHLLPLKIESLSISHYILIEQTSGGFDIREKIMALEFCSVRPRHPSIREVGGSYFMDEGRNCLQFTDTREANCIKGWRRSVGDSLELWCGAGANSQVLDGSDFVLHYFVFQLLLHCTAY